ncbi:dihydrofolate reductase [Bacillus solimangrovi]|uniref:Dihydrofolate reductase n=1 Tax=Bacillus solimangrovi TaxID=1305675 RepID=A0A1E5LFI5_9BACI|nr:dihydrofolate reductase [Bacillus solimangrovi]OEH92823.1 dihydrofolate reductase [Bacillus solimangrovi]
MISLLVAVDKNRLIGKENELPWHLPEDLKYFKRVTMGKTIVMGRKTFESIGRPLPGRDNVVLTTRKGYQPEGVFVYHSINEIVNKMKDQNDEVFFIGGAEIFNQVLQFADKLYITKIDESFEGDIYFPSFNEDEWRLVTSEKGLKNEKNPYDYYFQLYERI